MRNHHSLQSLHSNDMYVHQGVQYHYMEPSHIHNTSFFDVPVDNRRSHEKKSSELWKIPGRISPIIQHEEVHTSPSSNSNSDAVIFLETQIRDLNKNLEKLKLDNQVLHEKIQRLEESAIADTNKGKTAEVPKDSRKRSSKLSWTRVRTFLQCV